MILNDFNFGVSKLWATDTEYQEDCLRGIVTNVRRIKDEQIIKYHVDYLRKQKAFFVHNHDYLLQYFEPSITDPKFGLYAIDGQCYLAGRLAIPIQMFDGSIQGFIGYSSKPKDWDPEAVFIKYFYPPKVAFTKGRYWYITPEEFKKAVEEGYICIVDGIFDKIILQSLGINAVSLCGSSLTQWHEYYLSFIKSKVVIADNDVAGRRLASYCKYKLSHCVEIFQSESGDIDSLLRTQESADILLKCINDMKSEGFLLSKKLPKIPSGRGA